MPEPRPYLPEGPQPLVRDIPEGDAYPVHALGPLRAAVEAAHDISQAPLAIAAQSALSVASLAVQGFANVETLGGAAPSSLFCLTIAQSGERKSSCDRLLMQGLRDYEAAAAIEYEVLQADHAVAREVWQAKHKSLLTDLAAKKDKVKATGAEADLRALGPEPRPPPYPHLTAQEPTFEGLLKLYQIGRPALGLFSDEAGGFVGGHGMNVDNKLKSITGYSKLWDGDPVNRIRAGDGATTYPGRRLAMHLMAQPVAMRPLLADREASGQGFLARFLMTEPPSAIGTRLRRGHNPASQDIIHRFAARLRVILDTPLPQSENNQGLSPRVLSLSEEASDLLWSYYYRVEAAQAQGQAFEHIRAYASKSPEQAVRIAGVLTLWENTDAVSVSAGMMANAITLAEFYLDEAKRLAEAGLISEETERAETLRKWLADEWPQLDVLPSDILQFGPNALRELKVVKRLVNVLVEAGHLIKIDPNTQVRGKMRREAYRIVSHSTR